MGKAASTSRVRRAAVAGTFYSADPGELRAEIELLLAAAPPPGAGTARPKALVVPHAGYVYSGAIAASAYAQLRAPGPVVERVLLLGPAHAERVSGLALPEADAFLTPLGVVPVDVAATARVADLPQVTTSASVHLREHSLEVQLPFLQVALGDFSVVPLAVGAASPEDVAEVLRALWGGEETLVVCSTDLSHYLEYGEAARLDRCTAAQILALDAGGLRGEQACGRTPLAGLLLEARRRGLRATLLDLRSSGDTAGDRRRVVGYGAFALHPPPAATVPPERPGGDRQAGRAAVATGLARAAIASLFGGPEPVRPTGAEWLEERRACFVSLHRQGKLRGCCGGLVPGGTLYRELLSSAQAAASRDPRFAPVAPEELPGLDIEVSVLSPLEPLEARDEEEALARLRPGVDGLLLEAGGRRAVFIPAMWDELPDPREFLSQLRRKAGLPQGWLPGSRLSRFSAERYAEAR